jgi:hypothetical protein
MSNTTGYIWKTRTELLWRKKDTEKKKSWKKITKALNLYLILFNN